MAIQDFITHGWNLYFTMVQLAAWWAGDLDIIRLNLLGTFGFMLRASNERDGTRRADPKSHPVGTVLSLTEKESV